MARPPSEFTVRALPPRRGFDERARANDVERLEDRLKPGLQRGVDGRARANDVETSGGL
jgi:hypothetical protein